LEKSGAISGYYAHRDANALGLAFEALVGGGAKSVLVDVGEATAATASANARAVARPLPELALVTSATWPVKAYVGWP
jgi:hypothetical protein